MPELPRNGDETHLLSNLVGLPRYLRRLGLSVGTRQTLDFLRALKWIDLGDRQAVFSAAQATLVNRAKDLEVFRRAFFSYWSDQPQGLLDGAERGVDRSLGRAAARPTSDSDEVEIVESRDHAESQEGETGARSYSAVEVLRRKDFSQLDDEERRALRWMIAELNVSLGKRKSRRWRSGFGDRLDFRRSVRLNLRYGGEWLAWARRRPRLKERPLVVLADVSGSMELYTRILLQFVYGLVRIHGAAVEAFVFGTRLTRITRALEQSRPEEALRRVSEKVPDWSGGTRIGRALHEFNVDWARRALGRGAVVLLVSDGWDRGDPEALQREIARLQRSADRLIWLNPLLGSAGYEPLTRGMQAALPHVDDFLPIHNFASLEDLARHLENLEVRGGARAAPNRAGFVRQGG